MIVSWAVITRKHINRGDKNQRSQVSDELTSTRSCD